MSPRGHRGPQGPGCALSPHPAPPSSTFSSTLGPRLASQGKKEPRGGVSASRRKGAPGWDQPPPTDPSPPLALPAPPSCGNMPPGCPQEQARCDHTHPKTNRSRHREKRPLRLGRKAGPHHAGPESAGRAPGGSAEPPSERGPGEAAAAARALGAGSSRPHDPSSPPNPPSLSVPPARQAKLPLQSAHAANDRAAPRPLPTQPCPWTLLPPPALLARTF